MVMIYYGFCDLKHISSSTYLVVDIMFKNRKNKIM